MDKVTNLFYELKFYWPTNPWFRDVFRTRKAEIEERFYSFTDPKEATEYLLQKSIEIQSYPNWKVLNLIEDLDYHPKSKRQNVLYNSLVEEAKREVRSSEGVDIHESAINFYNDKIRNVDSLFWNYDTEKHTNKEYIRMLFERYQEQQRSIKLHFDISMAEASDNGMIAKAYTDRAIEIVDNYNEFYGAAELGEEITEEKQQIRTRRLGMEREMFGGDFMETMKKEFKRRQEEQERVKKMERGEKLLQVLRLIRIRVVELLANYNEREIVDIVFWDIMNTGVRNAVEEEITTEIPRRSYLIINRVRGFEISSDDMKLLIRRVIKEEAQRIYTEITIRMQEERNREQTEMNRNMIRDVAELPVEAGGDEDTCPICLTNKINVSLMECNHKICSECVVGWVGNNFREPTCPMCRAMVVGVEVL